MKTHQLRQPDGAKRPRKRRGRGIAAGQGKTGGYGTKGQNARSGRGGKPYFEGGQLPLVRRLPHKRGFSNPNRVEFYVVNVEDLKGFAAGSLVDPDLLIASGLVRDNKQPVKILGNGNISVPLTVRAKAFSASAKAKIEAAGGTVEVIE
ncbi:MAG: 50S ribosomal protein L15 [Chloroflexi bacterium]|nr:50S ribosomal protein L15 [Chloroflexota bacterium]